MKIIITLAPLALLFSSCVSTSNLFQDGKTLGKDSLDAAFSVTFNQMPNYVHIASSDTSKKYPVVGKGYTVVPWVQLQGQYGVTNRLDLGASIGVGIYSFGLQGFAKYALLPKDSKMSIALMALGGASFSDMPDEDDDVAKTGVRYFNSLYAIPISFPVSRRVSLVFQPMYGTERLTLKADDPDPSRPAKVTKTFYSYRLGTGVIVRNRKGTRTHYNITTAYYPASGSVVPTFGVALFPGR